MIIPRVYLTSDPEPQIDNPEKGSLVIRLDREKWSNSELRFTDANGISVENLKFSGEKDSIVLARPQSGVYYLEIRNTERLFTRRLVVL